MIERKIVIGLVTSDDFITRVRPVWNPSFLESEPLRVLATWCIEYFDQYRKAPMRSLEDIYWRKLKEKKIKQELAETIEEDILPSLNDEYEEEHFNLEHALFSAMQYFNERHIEEHTEQVRNLLDRGEVEEAKSLISDFRPILSSSTNDLDLTDPLVLSKLKVAFSSQNDPLIRYPGALGAMMNRQLVRGAFVGFLAPEKRGKTWWLMDMALRGVRHGCRVAFFQAGDMTEAQWMRRMSMYLAQRSDREAYTGDLLIPVRDCIHNQLDTCTKRERECDFGPFNDRVDEEKSFRYKITREELEEALKTNPDYRPCYNCKEYTSNPWGTPWYKIRTIKNPLTYKDAESLVQSFFIDRKHRLRLSTHANGMLTVNKIRTTLNNWEVDGFVPDIVIVDYADLLVCSNRSEYRHQQNQIWKDLRGLNQELDCLMVTVTQADAASYEKNRLSLSNFSEDKRKYGHVTAFYGLNQDHHGREKRLGIMYINELVLREDEFDSKSGVFILQSLKTGQPFLGSYK